jgi:hypothetical protein
MKWLSQNWYIFSGLLGLALIVAAYLYFRRNPEARGASAFFFLFPRADPTGQTPGGLTHRAVILWIVSVLILLIARLIVPDLK